MSSAEKHYKTNGFIAIARACSFQQHMQGFWARLSNSSFLTFKSLTKHNVFQHLCCWHLQNHCIHNEFGRRNISGLVSDYKTTTEQLLSYVALSRNFEIIAKQTVSHTCLHCVFNARADTLRFAMILLLVRLCTPNPLQMRRNHARWLQDLCSQVQFVKHTQNKWFQL